MSIHITRQGREARENIAFAVPRPGRTARPITASSVRLGAHFNKDERLMNGEHWPTLVTLPNMRPTSIDATTKRVYFSASDLTGFDTRAAPYFVGLNVQTRRYSLTSGVTVSGEATITAAKTSVITRLGVVAGASASASWQAAGYMRPSTTYYFRVACVGASGALGPWSNVASWTSAAVGRVQKDLPTIARTISGVDGALPTPTLSIANDSANNAVLTVSGNGGLDWVVEYAYEGTFSTENWLELSTVAGMQTADQFIVHGERGSTIDEMTELSPRTWGDFPAWQNHGIGGVGRRKMDLPVGVSLSYGVDGGHRYFRLTGLSSISHTVSSASHSGMDQQHRPVFIVGRTYKLRVRMRAASAVTVNCVIMGIGADSANITIPISVGTAWTEQDIVITPQTQRAGSPILYTNLTLTGAAWFDVAQFVIWDASAPDPWLSTPEERQFLSDGDYGYIRQHDFAQPGLSPVDGPRMLAWPPCNLHGGVSISQILKVTFAARTLRGRRLNPWFQLPIMLSVEDIRLIAEYIYSPYDPANPDLYAGSKLRHDHGRDAPWIDAFDVAKWEAGNEIWQSPTLPAFERTQDYNGLTATQVAALAFDRMANIIKATPGYIDAKSEWYAGGWNAEWTRIVATTSQHAQAIGPSDYIGGWDAGGAYPTRDTDPADVAQVLANSGIQQTNGFPNRRARVEAARIAAAAHSVTRGSVIEPEIYESGSGYDLVNQSDLAQERLMKSVGAAMAWGVAVMIQLAGGYKATNLFTIAKGLSFSGRSHDHRGGVAYPATMLTGWMNSNLWPDGAETADFAELPIGNAHRVTLSVDETKTKNAQGVASVTLLPDAGPAAQGWVIKSANGATHFFLANTHSHEVQSVILRKAPGGMWRKAEMPGPHTLTNFTLETKDAVQIVETDISAAWAGSEVTFTLDPGKWVCFTRMAADEPS